MGAGGPVRVDRGGASGRDVWGDVGWVELPLYYGCSAAAQPAGRAIAPSWGGGAARFIRRGGEPLPGRRGRGDRLPHLAARRGGERAVVWDSRVHHGEHQHDYHAGGVPAPGDGGRGGQGRVVAPAGLQPGRDAVNRRGDGVPGGVVRGCASGESGRGGGRGAAAPGRPERHETQEGSAG